MFRILPGSRQGRAVRKTSHSCHLMSQHALQWDALQQQDEWTDGHHTPASALATKGFDPFFAGCILCSCAQGFSGRGHFYKATKDMLISDLLTYHPIFNMCTHSPANMHAQVCTQHMWVRKEGKRKRPCYHTQLHGGMYWPQAGGSGQRGHAMS